MNMWVTFFIWIPFQQERKRLLSKYPPSPYCDRDECKTILEQHKKWVLDGDEPEDGQTSTAATNDLYPLPHKAYGERVKDDEQKSQNQDNSKTISNTDDVANENISTKGESTNTANDTTQSSVATISLADDESTNGKIDELFANN